MTYTWSYASWAYCKPTGLNRCRNHQKSLVPDQLRSMCSRWHPTASFWGAVWSVCRKWRMKGCVKICRHESDQWYVKLFDKGSLQCSGKNALGNNSGTRHLEVYVCFYLDQGGYQMWDFQTLSVDMSSQIHDRSDRDRNLLSDILEKLVGRISVQVRVSWDIRYPK